VQPAVQGAAGAAGERGPQGSPGPAGATGLGFAAATEDAVGDRRQARRGPLPDHRAGALTGTLRRGKVIVRRITQKAKRGLNAARLRTAKSFRPGRYTLALRLRSGKQRATATIRVTVRKR
jgi:hypothetical protein